VFPNGVTRVDQPTPPWDMAHYDRVGFGGGGASSPWGNGMILASTLWDLRQRIGAACDSLVLESLVYLPTVPTWGNFANALFLADQDHHASRYWTAIGEVLSRRGITGTASASISGPAASRPNETAEFRALPCCSGVVGHYGWRARRWCRGRPCEPWQDVGDGQTLRTSFVEDTELQLSVASPFGGRDTASMLVHVRAPFVALVGPTRVTRDTPGTWTARIVAMSPWSVMFERRWLPGTTADPVQAQGTSVTFTAEASFVLTATVRDALGRPVSTQLQVEAVTGRPPPSSSEALRLTQSVDAARAAETRVELAQATSVRVAVYDIRGRERLRLADGSSPRGERVIRWDATILESGIYFVRAATTTGHSAVLRFVVIR
jgi:hypothetical protein